MLVATKGKISLCLHMSVADPMGTATVLVAVTCACVRVSNCTCVPTKTFVAKVG